MLNKIFVVGEVISNVSMGQTGASNLDFVRFKIEIKNKNNQKPTNFFVIGFGLGTDKLDSPKYSLSILGSAYKEVVK